MQLINYNDSHSIYVAISETVQCDSKPDIVKKLTEIREKAAKLGSSEAFDTALSEINAFLDDNQDMQRADGFLPRCQYTYDDFASTDKPYRELFNLRSEFERNQWSVYLDAEAKACGYKAFIRTYRAFISELRRVNTSNGSFANPTDFPFQPFELEAGEWKCDHEGVRKESGNKPPEIACRHPIMPVETFTNIDTGEEKT